MSSHPCSGCNADLAWSPGAGELLCPYCGTTTAVKSSPVEGDVPRQVVEYDLDAALSTVPRGWAAEVVEFRCTHCNALSAVETHVTATCCAFCGTSQLEVQPVDEDLIRPESLLPFSVEEGLARKGFTGWVKGLWFRPNDLKRLARLDGLKGVYIPVWTFDMKTTTDWQAEAGFYYYVQVPAGNGKTRRERRTRWEWRNGNVRLDFDDWLVQASAGLSSDLFDGLRPFDTDALVPYDTRYLAGFVAERYQLDLHDAWDVGVAGMVSRVHDAVLNDIPGDTYRSLSKETNRWDETFKHCLVPVWISAYRYKSKTFHYVVNGVTGTMNGTAPYSWVKITLAILAALLVGSAAYLYATRTG
jgi:LSD1 subclass zinc finger protein